MKKRVFKAALFLLIIFAFTAVFSLYYTNDAGARDKLKEKDREILKNNNVSAVTEYDIVIKTGKKNKKSHSVYNAKGLKTESIEYKPNNQTLDKRFEFSYDTHSNEINQAEYNINGIVKSSRESSYDTAGVNLLKEVFFNNKNIAVKLRVYTYDDAKNAAEQITYGIDDKIESKITAAYDNKGYKTEQSVYDRNDKLTSKWLYNYDDKGNLTEAISQNGAGDITGKWVYSYDQKSLLDKITCYNSKNTAVTSKKFEYEFRAAAPETQRSKLAQKYNTDESKPFIDPEFGDPDAPHVMNFINQVQVATAEEIERMLDEGKFDLNYQSDNGWTALISAASYGNAEGVKALLAKGAKAELKDGRGMTAMDYAVKIKDKEIIKLLRGGK
jgi:hypothetical protein